MTQLSDYTDRLIDVSAFSNVREQGESLLAQQLMGEDNSGYICTGVQKIMQRFLLRLFTIKGSMIYSPNEGCNFMLDLVRGRFRSSVDVFASFAEAKADILEQFEAEELESDPDDERLDEAELLQVTLIPDFLGLSIRLLTVAGTERKVIVPIPVVV